MSGNMRVVAALCTGVLLTGTPFVASPHDIGAWVEATYRCGPLPGTQPGDAARTDREVSAIATVEVGADGHVIAVDLDKPSGSAAFDRSIVDSIRAWQFAPRIKEGRPQAVSLAFRFERMSGRSEIMATTIGMPSGRDFQLRPRSCDAAS